MRRTSFTFNFNKKPPALFWVIIGILIIETIVFKASGSFPSRNITELAIYNIEHIKYDSDIVLLSDSVGNQLLWSIFRNYRGDKNKFIMLASNGGIEMPGQYFLIKRYLMRNKKPKAVVFVGINPLGVNLSNIFVENYVQRCFLSPDEIFQLTLAKGPKFGFIMLVYKFFPSYRHRFVLQKALGFITLQEDSFKKRASQNSKQGVNFAKKLAKVVRRKSQIKNPGRLPLSDRYLDKLVGMLDKNSIKFYFVTVPMTENYRKKRDVGKMYIYFKELARKHDNFNMFSNCGLFPDQFFIDDKLHLTPEGIALTAKLIEDDLVAIESSVNCN